MATLLSNSAHKVQAAHVETVVGLIPQRGAIVFDMSDGVTKFGTGTEWVNVLGVPYADTYFRDLLGPLIGQRLDAAQTRYNFDVYNAAINFHSDARYPNEIIVQHPQINHDWKIGTDGGPHLHWKQQSANIPNWLMAWKLDVNGEPGAIETDFTNWNFEVISSHAFTYTSGVLNQISVFPNIDLSAGNISSLLSIALWRDTTNASGLFTGADPEPLDSFATDLDCHIEIDGPGSDLEYVK